MDDSKQRDATSRRDAKLFQKAISEGNMKETLMLAEKLASAKTPIVLSIDETASSTHPEIRVLMHIEDRMLSETSIFWSFPAEITIWEIKQLMFAKFSIPIEVQRIIVDNRLAPDSSALKDLVSASNELIMYLYLLSARSVGLRRQNNRLSQRYRISDVSDYIAPYDTCDDDQSDNDYIVGIINDDDNYAADVETVNHNHGDATAVQHRDTDVIQVGWRCVKCTLINEPTFPGCQACSTARPDSYVIPDGYVLSAKELKRLELEQLALEQFDEIRSRTFEEYLTLDGIDLIPCKEEFTCPVCMDTIAAMEGVTLRECLHSFCKDCLRGHIQHIESALIGCPYRDDEYQCMCNLLDREIKALVGEELYERYLNKSLREAESKEANSYHCKTPNCDGWCIYEDDVNEFNCLVCAKTNCLTCKAIHEGIDCRTYQDNLKQAAANDETARQTQQKIDEMLANGDAMHCPVCKIVIMKKDGCDWLVCTTCKTELCWVTKGARWGKQGRGDTSGGCKCGVNGNRCHARCQNCH